MSESESVRTAVVVLAAGDGRRVGAGTNKVLLPLAGSPVFAWSLRAVRDLAREHGYVERLVLVVREQDRDVVTDTLDSAFPELRTRLAVDVVAGGATRHASEWNALQVLAGDVDAGRLDVVAIHDSARPLAPPPLFHAVIAAAAAHGGALPVHAQRFLLPREPGPGPAEGRDLVAVQTPQAFRAAPLLAAYRCAERDGFTGTDTAVCVARYADAPRGGESRGTFEIRRVASPATNLKITFPEDVAVAERLLHLPHPAR